MNGDDIGFFEWCFKGIVGGVFVVGAYLWNQLVTAVKQNKTDTAAVAKDLSDHRLYIAQTIPTKIEMTNAIMETKESVKRIHERLDDIQDYFVTHNK